MSYIDIDLEDLPLYCGSDVVGCFVEYDRIITFNEHSVYFDFGDDERWIPRKSIISCDEDFVELTQKCAEYNYFA